MLSNRSVRYANPFILIAFATIFLTLLLSAFPNAAHAAEDGVDCGSLTIAAQENSIGDSAQIEDGVYVISSGAKKSAVLQIAAGSTSANAKLEAGKASCLPYQRWRITGLGDGYYRIDNVGTGKTLGVSKSKVVNGTAVRQGVWKARAAQKWKIVKQSGGYILVSALSDKYTLRFAGGKTAKGTNAGMYAIRKGRANHMRLTRIEPVLKSGIYALACKASGRYIEATAGNVDIGTNVQQGGKKAPLECIFQLKYDENTGYYRILAPASGLALDVAGASNSDGTNVQLYTSNGTAAQRWAIACNADGTYTLRSATGGRALDIEGASTAAGANAQIYKSNGTNAQKWRIKAVSRWLPNGTYTFASCLKVTNMVSVKSASKAKGAKICTAKRVNANEQKWTVTYNKKAKAYTIRNKNSKLMLQAASTRDGAYVRQAKANGKKNQLWIPRITTGGIRFASAADPKIVLSVAGSSKSVGADIVVTTDKSKASQKFRLRDASKPVFKVYLNPGHGWNSNGNGAWDTGAQGSGYAEADFTHDLARRVQSYCESYGIEVVNGEQFSLAYWERLPKAVSLKCNVIVSIHFDWSGAGVSGTHTMVGVHGKAAGSDLLNDIIHRHLVAATGLPDLGTFDRDDITAVNGAIPSMLMEVCFMDNANDVATYLAGKDRIAKAIAAGILEASRQPSLN